MAGLRPRSHRQRPHHPSLPQTRSPRRWRTRESPEMSSLSSTRADPPVWRLPLQHHGCHHRRPRRRHASGRAGRDGSHGATVGGLRLTTHSCPWSSAPDPIAAAAEESQAMSLLSHALSRPPTSAAIASSIIHTLSERLWSVVSQEQTLRVLPPTLWRHSRRLCHPPQPQTRSPRR